MTPSELAVKLNGIEFPVNISTDLINEAKQSGLVIVYMDNYDEEVIVFKGAIEDAIDCYLDAIIYVHPGGLLPLLQSIVDYYTSDEDEPELEAELQKYLDNKKKSSAITAKWNNDGLQYWTFETTISHAEFAVVDDGNVYCFGIVFRLADVGAEQPIKSPTNGEPTQWARGLAATAWCKEKTSHCPMNADLAEEFARILDNLSLGFELAIRPAFEKATERYDIVRSCDKCAAQPLETNR